MNDDRCGYPVSLSNMWLLLLLKTHTLIQEGLPSLNRVCLAEDYARLVN